VADNVGIHPLLKGIAMARRQYPWMLAMILALAVAGCERKATPPAGASAASKPPTGVKATLELKPKAGQKMLITTEAKQIITQTPPGESKQINHQDILCEYQYDVTSVEQNGLAHVRITYQRMKMSGPTGTGDSAGTGTGVMDRICRAIVGKSFEADFTRTGAIAAARGMAAIYEGIGPALPELTAAQKSQVIEQMKTQFGEEALKKQFSTFSEIYPATPVDNGEVWQKVASASNFGMQIASDFKLLEHDATTAKIGVSGKLQPLPMNAPLRMGNIELRYALEGTQNGTIEMDVQTGWTRSSEITQDFSGTVEASGAGISGTQKWPLSLHSVTTVNMR
jgi:hypothetical protein